MTIGRFLRIAAVPALLLAVPALASPQKTDTPADTIHPDIHTKVGQGDGTNANPNGNGNGGKIHGIGNVPGQNENNSPSNGVAGFVDQLETVHGNIGDYNPQVP